jgi:hypothetical protein
MLLGDISKGVSKQLKKQAVTEIQFVGQQMEFTRGSRYQTIYPITKHFSTMKQLQLPITYDQQQ